MDPEHWSYRFTVLFFNCMLTFGSYYCFDMPSVLQSEFQGNITCNTQNVTNGSSPSPEECCTDCLGMTPDQYNLLYAIYAWTNALVVIGAGFLIDKLGNRFGVFLFSLLCVIGSSLFALGAMFRGTKYLLPIMLVGRLLFGSGNGSLTIAQNRITAFWFRDKELAMAFGITLAFSRLGSVLNFFLTETLEAAAGLQWTLWIGAFLCAMGFLSAIIVGVMDVWGMRQLGHSDNIRGESKKLGSSWLPRLPPPRFSDVKNFTLSYWLLVLGIMTFYNGVFPFVADASKFIQDKYGLDRRVSAYLAGAVYDVSMVLSPFLGGVIDIIGKRGVLALLTSILTIPVFGILAFTDIYPLVATLWLGITYSFAAASLWPSIPLVVSQSTIGTAMGFATSIQMIGIGLSNLIVGQLLGDGEHETREETLARWKYVMIYLLANILACVLVTLLLNLNDVRKGRTLNQSRRQKLERLRTDLLATQEDDEEDGPEPDERTPILAPRQRIN